MAPDLPSPHALASSDEAALAEQRLAEVRRHRRRAVVLVVGGLVVGLVPVVGAVGLVQAIGWGLLPAGIAQEALRDLLTTMVGVAMLLGSTVGAALLGLAGWEVGWPRSRTGRLGMGVAALAAVGAFLGLSTLSATGVGAGVARVAIPVLIALVMAALPLVIGMAARDATSRDASSSD